MCMACVKHGFEPFSAPTTAPQITRTRLRYSSLNSHNLPRLIFDLLVFCAQHACTRTASQPAPGHHQRLRVLFDIPIQLHANDFAADPTSVRLTAVVSQYRLRLGACLESVGSAARYLNRLTCYTSCLFFPSIKYLADQIIR